MRPHDPLAPARRVVYALSLSALFCASLRAEPLHIYVGQGQMPFADASNAGKAGLFGDLMRELCQRVELQCVFRNVPWRRVLAAASEDPHGILLNLGRTAEREDDFTWLLDVLPTAYTLVSLDRSFDSLEDALRAGPVAVMAGTPRADEINAQRRDGQRVVEVSDPEQAAQLLLSRRVVAWYEIDLRVLYLWNELDDPVPLQFGAPLSQTRSHIAGNLELADKQQLQAQLNQAFAEMRQDGSWQRILGRYLGERKSRALLSDGW